MKQKEQDMLTYLDDRLVKLTKVRDEYLELQKSSDNEQIKLAYNQISVTLHDNIVELQKTKNKYIEVHEIKLEP